MTDIDEFLAKLNPKTAASFRKASSIELELLKTPSLGVNMAIGGLGYGRFNTLYGNKGAGKTMFATQCVAEAQKDGKLAAWIDVEKQFSPEWAARLGADPHQMLVDNTTISIAGMANKAVELILGGVDVLVIDSISQLLPRFGEFEPIVSGLESLAFLGPLPTFKSPCAILVSGSHFHNDVRTRMLWALYYTWRVELTLSWPFIWGSKTPQVAR